MHTMHAIFAIAERLHTRWLSRFLIAGLFLPVSTAHAGIAYQYDSLDRLTRADYGNGSQIGYTYDAAGNRSSYSGALVNDSTAPGIIISSPTSSSSFAT